MNENKKVTIPVSHYGESPTHWALLVVPMRNDSGKIIGYHTKEWFPKDTCELKRLKGDPDSTTYPYSYFLTAPASLLDKKGIEYEKQKTD